MVDKRVTNQDAPSSEDASPLPLLIEQALSQFEDDRELLLEVVEIFVETIPELLQDLQKASEAADADAIAAVAHSIKGAAANICAEPIRASAAALESDGRQGSVENAGTMVTRLHQEFDAFKAFAQSLG